MLPPLRLTQQGLLLVAIPLVFELAFVGILSWLLNIVQAEARAAEESKIIIAQIDTVEKELYKLFTDWASEFAGHNGRSKSNLYELRRTECRNAMTKLAAKLKNRYNADTVAELETEMTGVIDVIDKSKDLVKSDGLTSVLFYGQLHLTGVQDHMDVLLQDFDQIQEHEKSLSRNETASEENARHWLLIAVYSGVAVNIVVALIMAQYFSRSVIAKMQRLGENAKLFAQKQPMLPALKEETEFAELDRTLHNMALIVENSIKRERAAIENAVEVICTISDKGKFVHVSPAAISAWGYEPDILIGRPYSQLTLGASFDSPKELNSEQFEWECEMERYDSTRVITSWSVKVSSDGTFFCVVRDITEKKRAELLLKASEAEIRSLVDNMFTAVIKTGADGIILSANPRTEELLGYSSNELVGEHLSKIFKRSAETSASQLFESLTKSALNHVVEYTALGKSQEEIYVDVCLSRYESTAGDAYVVNILDSSERRKVQELKQQFTAMISHDLRTPLASVSIMLELTLTGAYGEISETCANRIETAMRNVTRLMNLIDELLEIEKLDSGTMQLELSSVDVSSVLNQAVTSVEDFAERNGCKLEAMPCELTLRLDEKRIVQVLINLLSNAIKFSGPNTTIRLEASKQMGFGIIKVIDQGQGISKESIAKLFDRFTSTSKTGRGAVRSTGLGLSICKSIVELHDGRIEVESEIGVGTTFSLWFPEVASISQAAAVSVMQSPLP
jgi:PAS domain S-box-containing protein